MTLFYRALPVSAVFVATMGSAAYADVTPSDIWQAWEKGLRSSGAEVTVNKSENGDTLTLTDIKTSYKIPETTSSGSYTISELSFKDNGDGTVGLICPDVITVDALVIDTPKEGGSPVETPFTIEVMCADITTAISGDPDAMTFEYAGPKLTLQFKELADPEGKIEFEKLEFSLSDLKGQNTYAIGENYKIEFAMDAKEAGYIVDMKDLEESGSIVGNAVIQDFAYNGSYDIPGDMSEPTPEQMRKVAVSGGYSFKNAKYEMNITNPDDTMKGIGSVSDGQGEITAKDGGLQFGFSSNDIKLDITEGIPFPVQLAVKGVSMNMAIPFAPSDDLLDIGMGMKVEELSLPDILWGMFDPTGKLPHDPITVAFDVSGKGKLAVDPSNPEQIAGVEDGKLKLGEMDNMDLKTLHVSALGAELTGSGAVSFDNSKLEETGAPIPDGAIDLKLVGSNALLDNLSAIGLLPADQAAGVRMMLNLFAVPDGGEDSLTSKIEFSPDGAIKANGQRIK